MMDHLILSAQHRVFIPEDVKTMRTGGDDLFDAIIVQHLDILVSHHLEKELIPGPAGRIACAGFFLAKDRIPEPRLVQDGGKRPGDLLRALVVTARTSYPEQNVRGFSFRD